MMGQPSWVWKLATWGGIHKEGVGKGDVTLITSELPSSVHTTYSKKETLVEVLEESCEKSAATFSY